MKKENVQLIALESDNPPSKFQDGPVCVCDFYVKGAENGDLNDWGFSYEGIHNIDHHAPHKSMRRPISSAPLAINYVNENGPSKRPIIINHTDCDSILSSGIVSGRLQPLETYGQAAIAADHTGERNDVADLLQAIEKFRDVGRSMGALEVLLGGGTLDPVDKGLLDERRAEREYVEQLGPRFTQIPGGIAYYHSNERIDGAFFPAALPDAKVIMVSKPMANGKLSIKVRLGRGAKGIYLNELDLPDFGGRWNAGGTSRHGGTNLSLKEYAEIVKNKIS